MLIDPKLLAAGRVLSGLSQTQLAEEAGIYRNAVQRIEAGADLRASTLKALLDVLARHGVDFVAGSPTYVGGVMLRAPEPVGQAVASTPPTPGYTPHGAGMQDTERTGRQSRTRKPGPR